MRTKTQEINLYTYEELSEKAQEKALSDYVENIGYDWWEFVLDDVKEIASVIGIDIYNVYFSISYSQGDGACFEGSYSYKKGGLKRLKENYPNLIEVYEIAKNLQDIQRRNFYEVKATVEHTGRYYHENCTVIDVSKNGCFCDNYSEEIISQCLRNYMKWIYKQLEKEYEHITSEESFIEASTTNGWEYTADGTIY